MTDKPKTNLQAPRGTRDFFFEKAEDFAALERSCVDFFRKNHYRLIRTPIFESVELFRRSIGEETDIVEKEMFVFKDRGEREYALRPEGTAPVVRAYLENSLANLGKITRLYYSGPMFRAERPQEGRYREFWQIGAECFGIKDPSADADVIVLLHGLLRTISSNKLHFSIHINSLGCLDCRPKFREALNRFLQEHKNELCADCQRRMVKNPLRVLDCKTDADKLSKAPTPLEYLCPICREYFEKVQKILGQYGCPFIVVPRLVRGLDYYTGTVFEVVGGKSGAQNALGAGGRYDTLVSELGGPPTPAIGFAIGLDRVIEALNNKDSSSEEASKESASVSQAPANGNAVFIVVLGEEATAVGYNLIAKLREAGFTAPGLLPNDSLKSQMRYAGSCGARWAVILGDRELQDKSAMVKDLSNSSQEKVPMEGLIQYLKAAAPAEKAS